MADNPWVCSYLIEDRVVEGCSAIAGCAIGSIRVLGRDEGGQETQEGKGRQEEHDASPMLRREAEEGGQGNQEGKAREEEDDASLKLRSEAEEVDMMETLFKPT